MTSTIRSPPALSDYVPLAEHQEKTPETFHGGKPVLHYHATSAKAWVPASQRGSLPIFPADLSSEPTAPENSTLSGAYEEMVEQKVDIFVNTESLTIYCPTTETGVSISYPLISIHAIKTLSSEDQKFPSVYLQLDLSDGGAGDDDFETVELTLIAPPKAGGDETVDPISETKKLFEAISECSNLNPDPVQDGDDEDDEDRIVFEADHQAVEGYSAMFSGASDGGLPPPMPGSTGWITAENVNEFFDADGNWIGGNEEEGVSGELGEGAGTVHGRGEEGVEAVNGHETDDAGETKRPRRD